MRVGDVITFQSASFPASRGEYPGPAQAEASGLACLSRIIEFLPADSLDVVVCPFTDDEPGSAAFVECQGYEVGIYLEWYEAGPPRRPTRDVWTLQILPSGWLRRLLPWDRRRGDRAALAVADVVESTLRALPDEFSEVRRCRWKDLDS